MRQGIVFPAFLHEFPSRAASDVMFLSECFTSRTASRGTFFLAAKSAIRELSLLGRLPGGLSLKGRDCRGRGGFLIVTGAEKEGKTRGKKLKKSTDEGGVFRQGQRGETRQVTDYRFFTSNLADSDWTDLDDFHKVHRWKPSSEPTFVHAWIVVQSEENPICHSVVTGNRTSL
ncbi:Hypothetical protein NTJ_13512 [Nesidiocoris tenuis]|uniref:Uncharacterized protein n=1 Tax=Nesidiocoris tenuis TaxID=355587 RepID=A0ABN7BBX4_9HEMI|nr:Hypothetical protein NTJ_13512 [Nesidiocoris tenuis]